MANYTDIYRKPLMTDETGKAIANKLGGTEISSQGYNTSEYYRKPQLTDETAREILAKLDSCAPIKVNFTKLDEPSTDTFGNIFTCDMSIDDMITNHQAGKKIYATVSNDNETFYDGDILELINAGDRVVQNHETSDFVRGAMFWMICVHESAGMYSMNLIGKIEDNQDVWYWASEPWNNT